MTQRTGEEGSRTATVLEPSFVQSLENLPLEEVRRRRDEALAEREFQSYARRLVQVQYDLLSAERGRRGTGEEPPPVVERVTNVLSEGARAGTSRGEAPRFSLSADDVARAERRIDEALGGLRDVRPEDLSDDDLERALQSLFEVERAISDERSAVMRVHDVLQEELKRRYREDPSQALR